MNYKIGAYVRISTEEAAQVLEGSIASQKHRLQSWVDGKNFQNEGWGKILEIYSDEGISAKDMNRPAFQKMMRDLRKGKINLILVTELSRLSRSIMDFCHILEELKVRKAGFLSIKEQFDTSTPAGEMMVFNMINLAQFERKQVAERVSLNFHSRAMRGLLNGGRAPLGYDKDPSKKCTYIVNESEAAQIRQIFQTYLDQGSLAKAVRRLNEIGIQPKRDSKRKFSVDWNVKNLNQILRNRIYIGEREVNVKYKHEDQKTLKAFQKYSVAKASWPAIVESQLFAEVQVRLDEATKTERDRLSKSVYNNYWLSGIIRCPDCGHKYVGACSHGRNEIHRYYLHPGKRPDGGKCKYRRIRAEEIEGKIETHLAEILKVTGHFDMIQENITKSRQSESDDVTFEKQGLDKREAHIAAEIERLFERQMNSEGVAKELFNERLTKLGEERRQIRDRLSELARQIEDAPVKGQERVEIQHRVEQFNRGWRKATGAIKRRLSRRVLARLIPTEEGLEVFYFFDGDGFGRMVDSEKSDAIGASAVAVSEAQKTKRQDLSGVLSLACAGSDIMKIGWGGRTRTFE